MKVGTVWAVGVACLVWAASGSAQGAQLADVSAHSSRLADVALAERATAPTLVRDPQSGISIAFRFVGARDVPPRRTAGRVEFPGALAGDSIVLRVLPDGAEDHVVLPPGSRRGNVRYAITLGGVEGLRNVGNALELLDADGTPRLRVAPPYLIANDGATHEARLTLLGCAADRSPLPPWRRAVVAPGARECELVVSWDPAVSLAGAVLDPLWVKTGDMAMNRSQHSATLLSNGLVLVGGEKQSAWETGRSTELYDPATGTWAMGSQANVSLNDNLAARLGTNKVMFFMGSKVQLYDETTGLFSDGPSLTPGRDNYAMTRLANGSVLVSGGQAGAYFADAHIFDAATETWIPTGPMKQTRARHTATLLPSGWVLVTGGNVFGTLNETSEAFNPSSGVWGLILPMGAKYAWHVAGRLTDDRVLVHGGQKQSAGTTRVFDPTTAQWSASASAVFTRYAHSGVALPGGSFIVTGGYGHDSSTSLANKLANAEVWSPTGKWTLTAPMVTAHAWHTTTLLPGDGTSARVLVTGGDETGRVAEVLEGLLPGQPCSVASQCLGHSCVDGFCCDSGCVEPCMACASALTEAGADGECAPVKMGTDPGQDCEAEATSTCGRTGNCDGAGACALHAAGTKCSEGDCWTNHSTFLHGRTYACDGEGECEQHTNDCCYHNGKKLDYCSCAYGTCNFPSAGTGGGSVGGSGGSAASSGYGGSPATGGSSPEGKPSNDDSSGSGCGCSLPATRFPLSPPTLLAALALATVRRRRTA